MRKKQSNVYIAMRCRIALRKAGVLPVDNEIEEQRLVEAEKIKVKANRGTEVTEDDILQALERGEEVSFFFFFFFAVFYLFLLLLSLKKKNQSEY